VILREINPGNKQPRPRLIAGLNISPINLDSPRHTSYDASGGDMSDKVVEDAFGDFDQEAETEKIEDFFLLSDKDKWENGDCFGADKI
jgi:hypothetical protein